MPAVFQVKFHKTKRKGVGIIESIILMVIVGVTFGAIFSTIVWAQRSHAFSRQNKESRELFFNWVQSFESMYPHPTMTVSHLSEAIAEMLNGTYENGTARIGYFTVTATEKSLVDGVLVLGINIRTTGGDRKVWVDLDRAFNSFSNEPVPDVVEG